MWGPMWCVHFSREASCLASLDLAQFSWTGNWVSGSILLLNSGKGASRIVAMDTCSIADQQLESWINKEPVWESFYRYLPVRPSGKEYWYVDAPQRQRTRMVAGLE